VRPLRQITGEAEFNEIFFDNVEVPVENRLDDEGNGWQVAMTTLLHERATLGFALTATLDGLLGRLLQDAGSPVDPRLREAIAAEWIELQALRYTSYRALGTYERTGIPGPEGSGVKLRWSEANQRLTKLARELRGPEGILDDGWWNHQQLRSRGNTIEAGTSEVLRNIIAERILGLPRSR
jgi:alkylation response protein AidB-like acyl-CoA dehydrogenase